MYYNGNVGIVGNMIMVFIKFVSRYYGNGNVGILGMVIAVFVMLVSWIL